MTREHTKKEYDTWVSNISDWYDPPYIIVSFEEWLANWNKFETEVAEKKAERDRLMDQPCDPDCGCMDCDKTNYDD
tara:strand:- start:32 stop:259 length:228 start_codon:yes stop_codon:yes gene_type:complete